MLSPAILGVNTNTVLRSLRLLRDEGLPEFRRGRGISVAGTPERGAVVPCARRGQADAGDMRASPVRVNFALSA
jgi:DNA-binding transcriptional regulator YhcF (GntR family)